MDSATGRVLWERRGTVRLAPASTTKIMTAIVALEHGSLDQVVTVTRADLAPLDGTGSSVMGLQPGDQLTLLDLLYGLMLPSGNEASLVIARAVAGSVPAFIDMMNDKVHELQLNDTRFQNPHGLDHPDHYTTSLDMAIMARYAMQIPLFKKIVSSERAVVEASRTFYLQNTNRLLAYPDLAPGVDGVKTGTTGNAGDCIVVSVTRNGQSVIAVVMGSRGRNPDAIKLIDYAYSAFQWLSLPPPAHLSFGSGAAQRVLIMPDRPAVMLAPWERFLLDLRLDLRPPSEWSDGQPAGTATYLVGGPIETVALYPR